MVEEQTEFKFSELSPEARERAIEAWRDKRMQWWNEDDWQPVHADAKERLSELGFDVNTESDVEWRGFCSQGDGLVFSGTWWAAMMRVDQLYDHVGDIESGDEDLRAIAARLLVVFMQYPDALVRISTQHHGPGIGWMSADGDDAQLERDVDAEDWDQADKLAKEVLKCAKDLAGWWYRQLESEYDYYCSEAATIEDIEARNLIFDELGDEL